MYGNNIFAVNRFLDNRKVQFVVMSLLWTQVIRALLAQQFTTGTSPSVAKAILLEAVLRIAMI